MKFSILFFSALLMAVTATGQENVKSEEQLLLEKRIPKWVRPIIEKSEIQSSYYISDTINPFYLEGDFNGDKFEDIALRIINKIDGKHGILIVHGQTNIHYILGAGKDFGMGDDMRWVKVWYVHRDKTIKSFTDDKQEMVLKYPAIRIVKTESISAYFYWTGKKYKTFNQIY